MAVRSSTPGAKLRLRHNSTDPQTPAHKQHDSHYRHGSPASRKHRDGHSANRDRNGSWFGHGHAMVRDTQSAQSADGAGDAVQTNCGHPIRVSVVLPAESPSDSLL